MGMNPSRLHMDEASKLTFHVQQLVCSQSSSEPHPSDQWCERGPVDWNIDPQYSIGPLETESASELDQTSVIMNDRVEIGHSMSYKHIIYSYQSCIIQFCTINLQLMSNSSNTVTHKLQIYGTELSRMYNIHRLRLLRQLSDWFSQLFTFGVYI